MSTVDSPWQIPGSWKWMQMGQIADVVGGSTPRTTQRELWDGGDIPWLTPADLSGYKEKYISAGARNITSLGLEKSSARMMPAGTVLFSSRAPIGYVAIAANPVATNQGFKSFILDARLSSEYVYYYLQRARELAVKLSSGTTFSEISGKNAAKIPVPIAPLDEQRSIVGAIETQSSRLDAAEAALERVQSNLGRYRASVLKAAVEGRLVPTEAELARREGRDYEPASVLLERILEERRRRWEEAELAKMKAKGKEPKGEGWKAKYKEPVAVETEGLPELPSGWCWARAEQISQFITKGTTPKASALSAGAGDIPYIKVYNLTFDGSLNFENNPTFVTRRVHETELRRSLVQAGDVLMNIVGPPLGKVSLVPGSYPEWNIKQAVARFRCLSGVGNEFLSLALRSETTLSWAKRRAKATAGQFNLTLGICRDLPIPIAPCKEQQRIVAAVGDLFFGAGVVESGTDAGLTRCRRLRQSILKWAFEGKLVDQDLGDEPASALLERADRTAALGGKP